MLLGHERIREQLARSADAGTLHHAYLFEGPSGLGKRQVADWLSMYVNCTSGQRPCGVCPRCVQIRAGTHPDVIVLEPEAGKATRTIGVAAVREVVRKAGYHRYDSARRFILVDPADAMMEPAANALLKTLEEPTDGTGFILVVASASSLLPTIVSRCQRVRFGAVPTEAIASWLRGQQLDNADLAARASLGCPGRALSLARGGLQQREEARSTLVRLTTEPLPTALKLTESRLKSRARAEWMADVDTWFGVVEELLRDVSVRGSGSGLPLLHADALEVVDAWTERLYPSGVSRVSDALETAREQLFVQANGRLVMDAFVTSLRAELGTG